MKSIYLPLTVVTSLCLLLSCGNNAKLKADAITLTDIRQEEEKKPSSPPNQEPPVIAENQIADKEYFTTDSVATPQKEQKQQKDVTKIIQQPRVDWDKKIIKNAVINAEIKNYSSFYSSLREKVKNLGGYVAQEEQNQSDYKIENSIVIKVPIDKFDDAIIALTTGTEKIDERKITSQDVTAEYVDVRSRMETKKEMKLRYIDFLRQAKKMEDILSVQSEINNIQEEIESATGRINYLSHSSSFSTITFTFYQVLNISAKDKQGPSFLTKIGTSFKTGWQWTGDIIIGLVSIWPVILFFTGVWMVIRKYRNSKVKTVSTNS